MEYVLKMPVRRFFAMRKAALILDAHEKIDLLDIQAVSICNADYFRETTERFKARIEVLNPSNSTESPNTSNPPESLEKECHTEKLEHGTLATRDKIISAFAMQKRMSGHGA